jgi:hypothetical protein
MLEFGLAFIEVILMEFINFFLMDYKVMKKLKIKK